MNRDYQKEFKELEIDNNLDKNPMYPRSDIGVAKLFFDLHRDSLSFVREPNAWFFFNGKYWEEDK